MTRLLILLSPFSHSASYPMGHYPFFFAFFIRKHTKYLPWDKMNLISYITTHINSGPQRILESTLDTCTFKICYKWQENWVKACVVLPSGVMCCWTKCPTNKNYRAILPMEHGKRLNNFVKFWL